MELDLDRVIRIVRRWGVWLTALALVGVLSGILLSFTRPVEYASTTTLLLSPLSQTSPIYGFDANTGLQSQAEIYRYRLGTTPFLSQVAAQLGLDPTTGIGEIQAATSTVASQAVPTIDITVTSTDAARTTLWANTIAQTFVTYIGTAELTETGGAGTWVSVSIPQPAAQPSAPVSPRRPLWAVLGGVFGFLIAASAILVIEHLRSARLDVNRRPAALPVLSVIDALRPRSTGGKLLAEEPGNSDTARGIAQLRSAVQILTATQGIRTLAVGSLRPGEGKSTVVANLAVALAEAGDRVILVDANLVSPGLDETFGGRTSRGLTSLMADPNLDLADVVTSTNWANLMFIPAGPRVDEATIDRAAFRRTIAGIVPHADLVIFEAPTLVGTPDRLRFGTYADGLLLVVGGEQTRIEALRSISSDRAVSGGNVVGIVIDRGAGTVITPITPTPPPVSPNPTGLTLVGSSPQPAPALPEATPRLQPAMSTRTEASGMVRTQRAVPISEQEEASLSRPGPDRPEATA